MIRFIGTPNQMDTTLWENCHSKAKNIGKDLNSQSVSKSLLERTLVQEQIRIRPSNEESQNTNKTIDRMIKSCGAARKIAKMDNWMSSCISLQLREKSLPHYTLIRRYESFRIGGKIVRSGYWMTFSFGEGQIYAEFDSFFVVDFDSLKGSMWLKLKVRDLDEVSVDLGSLTFHSLGGNEGVRYLPMEGISSIEIIHVYRHQALNKFVINPRYQYRLSTDEEIEENE
eukprot:TRINITY_DN12636_c0_g1_i1.p1 TRINITY_DN12636_c0_g1~~TRINITY_DN12636_c0_g1_i1.p1  ORF type:complete len:227 (-),score=46.79 TRINITY_DN12636_c0_g1_i1:150-830(-)